MLAVAVVACGEPDVGNYPPPGGGGGGGGGSMGPPDAAPAPDAPTMPPGISGITCQADNMSNPLQCGAALGGVPVRNVESGDEAVSAADGRYLLPAASNHFVTLLVGADDAEVHDALVRYFLLDDGTGTGVDVPAVLEEDWTNLVTTLGQTEAPGDAAVVIQFLDPDGDPLVGVTARNDEWLPVVYYDNGGALEWRDAPGTGARGTALLLLLPSVAEPSTIVTYNAGGADQDIPLVIRPGTITFAVVTVE